MDLAFGITGIGMLVRNSRGSFIRACNSRLGRQQDPLMAEELGVREALSWLKDTLQQP